MKRRCAMAPPNILGKVPLFIKRETILDRRIWVYYLVILDKFAEKLGPQLQVRPDERFFEVLSKHVEAYLKEGKAPPKAIEGAVLNAADDFLAGRDISLRAGDYIAVQSFARAGK
jgi:molybdopterin converting factor small subunit